MSSLSSPSSSVSKTGVTTSFEVRVSKEAFKFNAAHFVAFKGFREKIHGHNYQVAVKLLGSRKIGGDGYVIDFGDIKAVTKKVCKDLNEHFLCPTLSNVIQITVETLPTPTTKTENNASSSCENNQQETVKLVCEDGSVFLFPRIDCVMLPLVHATTEELAIYLWGKILNELDAAFLKKRGIHTMEVTVAEAVGQEATFRYEIPDNVQGDFSLDVRTFIESGEIMPTPCLPKVADSNKGCDGSCQASRKIFSEKLQRLADSIKSGLLPTHQGKITADDLEKMIQ